jgi:hypothetical protein
VNTAGNGSISIINLPSTATLEKPGFSMNNESGVITSSNGAISLTNVNAFDNLVHGFVIVNNHGASMAGVTLTACRSSNNAEVGFTVDTYGAILVSNGIVNGNGSHAALLHNDLVSDTTPKAVTVNNSQFDGNRDSLEIHSKGAVSLSNVTYLNGLFDGISIDNSTLSNPVTLLNVKSNNIERAGFYINSKGLVKITSSEAVNNHGDGMQIITTGSRGIVTITSSKISGNDDFGLHVDSEGAVNLTSCEANNNDDVRFEVSTSGAITLSNVIGNGNLGGAELDNHSSTTHAGVTMNGVNSLSGNSGGMTIFSTGPVTLSGITADNNTSWGIYISNYDGSTLEQKISLSKINIRNNGGDGLYIDSNGSLTLSGVVSMLNTGKGINIFYSHNYKVTILNSVVAANSLVGVYANVGSNTLTLTNTLIFGNNPNLQVTH